MRKTTLLIFALLALAAHGQQRIDPQEAHPAQWENTVPQASQAAPPRKVDGLSATQRAVGYIVGNNPDSITRKGAMVGTAGTYPVGVAIPPAILDNYAPVFIVFLIGMIIHWLPDRFKRRYRLWFASMPVWLMAVVAVATVFVAYQFITADLQPFIYFQF